MSIAGIKPKKQIKNIPNRKMLLMYVLKKICPTESTKKCKIILGRRDLVLIYIYPKARPKSVV